MIVFSNEELSLIAYACREFTHKRCEQANTIEYGNSSSISKDFAEANRAEAKKYFAIAQRISEFQKQQLEKP